MLRSTVNNPTEVLERFITEGTDCLPPADLLKERGLAAYAASMPTATGASPLIHASHVAASARHAAIRSVLVELLRQWRVAGIEAVLFKGFHLAEYVYPDPGFRHYSDVDLLIRQGDLQQAVNVAQSCGWRVLWRADKRSGLFDKRGPSYKGHELLQLRHERVGVQLDVHRRLVHNNHNSRGSNLQQQRITRLAWARSIPVHLQGVQVRQLDPYDAVLIGLVLNRCWSPEDWSLRAHDYLDFQYLVRKYSLTPNHLSKRARELGCFRTLEIFLERCDPFRSLCKLTPPTAAQRQAWNLRVASERGNRYLQRALPEILTLLVAPVEMLFALPRVLRVIGECRRTGTRNVAERVMNKPIERQRELNFGEWKAIRRGTQRSFRLMGLSSLENRDTQSVALLAALRARGCPAELCWQAYGDTKRPRLLLDGTPLNVDGTLLAD